MLCIAADGKIFHPGVIFNGKGSVYEGEKHRYKDDVDVYFAKNAWMNSEVMKSWAINTYVPTLQTLQEEDEYTGTVLLFMDNLRAHANPDFINYVTESTNTKVFFGPADLTDAWQPLDGGIIKAFKSHCANEFESMNDKELLLGDGDGSNAANVRVMVVDIISNAMRQMQGEMIKTIFLQTGCGMSANSARDKMIKIQRAPGSGKFKFYTAATLLYSTAFYIKSSICMVLFLYILL